MSNTIPIRKINEFVKNERSEGFYLIKSVDLKTTNSNGKKYLDFVLADGTGEITAKKWEVKEGEESEFRANTIVKVRGMVTSWQSSLQLKVEQIRNIVSEDKVNIDDYVQSAPIDSKIMFETIKSYINNMKNEDIKNIVNLMVEKNKEK